MVEGAFIIFMNDFDIRQRRTGLRIPVDDIFAPINQALLIQLNEDLTNSLVKSLIQGETLAAVIK